MLIQHDLKIRDRSGCFPEDTFLEIKTQDMTEAQSFVLHQKLWNFSFLASILMMVVIFNIKVQDQYFLYSLYVRAWGGVPQGEERLNYATRFSMISNVLIFLVNFCMSVIYCQLIESSSFEIIFIIPCIMQLVILFYCARLIGLQLRIMAMDKFSDIKQ